MIRPTASAAIMKGDVETGVDNIRAVPGYLCSISVWCSLLLCGAPHFHGLLIPSARAGGLSLDFHFRGQEVPGNLCLPGVALNR